MRGVYFCSGNHFKVIILHTVQDITLLFHIRPLIHSIPSSDTSKNQTNITNKAQLSQIIKIFRFIY